MQVIGNGKATLIEEVNDIENKFDEDILLIRSARAKIVPVVLTMENLPQLNEYHDALKGKYVENESIASQTGKVRFEIPVKKPNLKTRKEIEVNALNTVRLDKLEATIKAGKEKIRAVRRKLKGSSETQVIPSVERSVAEVRQSLKILIGNAWLEQLNLCLHCIEPAYVKDTQAFHFSTLITFNSETLTAHCEKFKVHHKMEDILRTVIHSFAFTSGEFWKRFRIKPIVPNSRQKRLIAAAEEVGKNATDDVKRSVDNFCPNIKTSGGGLAYNSSLKENYGEWMETVRTIGRLFLEKLRAVCMSLWFVDFDCAQKWAASELFESSELFEFGVFAINA